VDESLYLEGKREVKGREGRMMPSRYEIEVAGLPLHGGKEREECSILVAKGEGKKERSKGSGVVS